MLLHKTTSQRLVAILFSAVMVAGVAAALMLKPTRYWADERTTKVDEQLVPTAFMGWHQVVSDQAAFVNPELQSMIDQLYTAVVAKTYEHADGRQVMLSIAYGRDQRDGLQMHDPEICYPAQGFAIQHKFQSQMTWQQRPLPLRQMVTENRSGRREVVSYWTLVGEQIVEGRLDKKLAEFEMAKHGLIADGLIFRVSTIASVDAEAFAVHQSFVRDLLDSLSAEARHAVIGNPS